MRLEVRDSSYLSLLSIFDREKRVFRLKACLEEKNCIFRVLLNVSSSRRTSVRLGGGENIHTKDFCYA